MNALLEENCDAFPPDFFLPDSSLDISNLPTATVRHKVKKIEPVITPAMARNHIKDVAGFFYVMSIFTMFILVQVLLQMLTDSLVAITVESFAFLIVFALVGGLVSIGVSATYQQFIFTKTKNVKRPFLVY